MAERKKRYAQVGMGGRSSMYTDGIVATFKDHAELVGVCDVNLARARVQLDLHKEFLNGDVPTYHARDFDRMVAEQKPDTVIVTTGPDVTHEQTGRSCQVTFNYRYSPVRSQVCELLRSGVIGQVLSVDFCWLLDTRHGADYFRRWHRRRENSGSLLVHKATHHFDLVNWWLDDVPQDVFCQGSLRYYTPEHAEALGLGDRAERCHGCPAAERCPFYVDLAEREKHKLLYLDCEQEDNYYRDRCVFSDQINIWDNMSVAVRYRGGALLNYILNAYAPYEGYKIAFNGTKGRLEHEACEATYMSGDGTVPGELQKGRTTVTLIPEFSQPQSIEPQIAKGGHGGADPILLGDVFLPNPPADPLRRKANQVDGAYSILIGVAAYHSIDSGQAVRIDDLLAGAPLGERW